MESSFEGPVRSEEMVTINTMAGMIMKIAGKSLSISYISGPTGVRGRNSDNNLLREKLGWEPSQSPASGLEKTYNWISEQVAATVRHEVGKLFFRSTRDGELKYEF